MVAAVDKYSRGREMVVRLAEPVDAVVGHARHIRIGRMKTAGVGVAVGLGKEPRPQERGIADDGVGLGPRCGRTIGGEEGVGGGVGRPVEEEAADRADRARRE